MSNQMIDDLIKEQHHRRFTNRETELDLFEQLALLSAPPFRIMGIHGTGGIGKTELLDEFRILCKEWDIPYLRVDGYAQKNLLSILSQLRTQAGKWVSDYHFSDFDRYLSLYLKMQKVASREEELIAGLQQTLRRSPHERAIVGALESAEKESITTLLSDLFEREDIQFGDGHRFGHYAPAIAGAKYVFGFGSERF